MKKIISFALIALFAFSSLSCSNDDDNSTPAPVVPVAGDGFTWTINGNVDLGYIRYGNSDEEMENVGILPPLGPLEE